MHVPTDPPPPPPPAGVKSIVSCGDDPVRIRCVSYHEMATVLEAWFYETAHVCREPPPPPPRPPSTAATAVPRYSVLDSFNARSVRRAGEVRVMRGRGRVG